MSIDFTGTWTADLSSSKLLGPRPKAISIKITHSDPELQEELVVTNVDGSEQLVVFTCWINGERDRSMLNGVPVPGTVRWEDEELVIESWVRFGARELHFCDYWSISQDRQTLFMEHRNDDLAGQLTVLKRQS